MAFLMGSLPACFSFLDTRLGVLGKHGKRQTPSTLWRLCSNGKTEHEQGIAYLKTVIWIPGCTIKELIRVHMMGKMVVLVYVKNLG